MNIEYREHTYRGTSSVLVKDEFGNKAEITFPHRRERGFGRVNVGVEWQDAQVKMYGGVDGTADEVGQAAEFALQCAHIAKTLDLSFAAEKDEAVERWEAERKLRDEVKKRALQWRCEEVAQFYMQLVRVQREGHSSHAKGELNVTMLGQGTEEERISARMYLRESNGNRWRFEADHIAKFEVKDGNRYNKVKFTPMATLEARAKEELMSNATAQ